MHSEVGLELPDSDRNMCQHLPIYEIKELAFRRVRTLFDPKNACLTCNWKFIQINSSEPLNFFLKC